MTLNKEQKQRYDLDRLLVRLIWGWLCVCGALSWFGLNPMMLLSKDDLRFTVVLMSVVAGASWIKSTVRKIVIEEAGTINENDAEREVARLEREREQAHEDETPSKPLKPRLCGTP
ncbi:MAG: hypothetical protein WB660_05680 [Candidatus Sulfotelmatobacter sp.]